MQDINQIPIRIREVLQHRDLPLIRHLLLAAHHDIAHCVYFKRDLLTRNQRRFVALYSLNKDFFPYSLRDEPGGVPLKTKTSASPSLFINWEGGKHGTCMCALLMIFMTS